MHARTVFLCLLLPLYGAGEGYELKIAGQKAAGMGGAFAAVASDASAVFYNPGAMSMLDMRVALSAGAVYQLSHVSFLGRYNPQQDAEKTASVFPQAFGTFRIGERLAAGIGFYAPFGYHVQWKDDWAGRYVSRESRLAVYTLQPTVSYKLGDRAGIGAGLLYSFGTWENRKALPAGDSEGEWTAEGNGTAIGFQAGFFFAFDDALKAGITVRSGQEFKIDNGTYAVTALPSSVAGDYPGSGEFTTALKLPAVVTAALSYRFTDEFLATAELSYARWSAQDSSVFASATDTSFDFSRDYRLGNALSGRVGVQYSFTESFDLRGGFAYDISPYNSNHLLPEMPDADRLLFTVGAGFRINDMLSVDVTAGMENFFERQGDDQLEELAGTYKTIRYEAGVAVNLSF